MTYNFFSHGPKKKTIIIVNEIYIKNEHKKKHYFVKYIYIYANTKTSIQM